MTATHPSAEKENRSTLKSVALAAAIIGSWCGLHVYSVFLFNLSPETWPLAVCLILLNTWLSVGLFIVAHDCMHGSLVPLHPSINRAVGSICLTLYAGFSFDELNRKHHLHHRHSGTLDDPDFHERESSGYLRWFSKFLSEYFGWQQFVHMTIRFLIYVYVLGASAENALLLWWIPALLSALQLFTFGTYLPHRPKHQPFSDQHRARSNDYSSMVSLLTCFHFGYHHEHHLNPKLPWWRLPKTRRVLKGSYPQ